jgi:hypothetical protein
VATKLTDLQDVKQASSQYGHSLRVDELYGHHVTDAFEAGAQWKEDILLKKARDWFNEHVGIQQEVETNENGEPLASSYLSYTNARLAAAREMYETFAEYVLHIDE